MKIIIGIASVMLLSGTVRADDPGDPDSVYIGNIDGSPILVGIGEEISVPLWLKTDDSVAFVHFPLASENYYIIERLGGEYANEYCIPNMPPGYPPPGSYNFLPPDSMNQDWTNQSLVVFWDLGEGISTNYEWCHKFNFFMRTTTNPEVIGEEVFCFDEGYNPINGDLLFGLSDGITEVIPQVVYGSIAFTEASAEDDILTPHSFDFVRAFPNPFNGSTIIKYALPEEMEIELSIYNILGQKVDVLLDDRKPPGRYAITWNAGNFPSGIYFARLESMAGSRTEKMLLLR